MDQNFTLMKQFQEALQVGDLSSVKKISSNEQYARLTVDVVSIDEAPVKVNPPSWSQAHYEWGLTCLVAIAAATPSEYSAFAIRNLHKNGADINHSGPEKIRPIHIAARQNNPQALSTLLRLGADFEARTETGKTPIHFCSWVGAKAGNAEGLDILILAGADVNSRTKG
ncbi:hypothetical protein TWF481_002788 [Arthrobotrys musiformis]|uniref:Ankyrin repeat protein n=1 Tax=Arthrobotrys musiformis TaxID=47236 RepID=A0AAV9VTP0_9PEZI